MRLRQKIFAATLALAGLFAAFWSLQSGPNEQRASIEDVRGKYLDVVLANMSIAVTLKMPMEYLGPSFLQLSKDALAGKEVKALPVLFSYPEVKAVSPYVNRTREQEETGLFATFHPTIKGSVARYMERKKTTDWEYVDTGEKFHGLSVYRIDGSMLKHEKPYYYYDPDDPELNVFIQCNNKFCRFRFNTKNHINISLVSVPVDHLHNWKDIIEKIRNFAEPLVVHVESRKVQ